jgi:gas vesicle protein
MFLALLLKNSITLLTLKINFMSVQKIVIGTLSGVLAGLAVGLLVAPATGSETRKKISDSADQLRKKIRSIRGSASDELNELQNIFEHEVDGLKDDVRERILKLIEASKMSYTNVKDEVVAN